MNYLRTKVLFVLLSFPFVLLAQKLDVQWGPQVTSQSQVLKVLGNDKEQHIYTLSLKKKNYFLERYDKKSLKITWSKPLMFPAIEGEKQTLLDFSMMNGRFVAVTEVYLKKKDLYVVNGYTVSPSGVLKKQPKELLTVTARSEKKAGRTEVVYSEEKDLLLLANVSFDSEDDDDVLFKVYDDDLSIMNSKGLDISIHKINEDEKAFVSVSNFILLNQRSVYFTKKLTYYDAGGFTYDITPENRREYFVVHQDLDGDKMEIGIDAEGLLIEDMFLKQDANKKLLFAGLYSKYYKGEKYSGPWLEGTIFMKIDGSTGEKIIETNAPFGSEMLDGQYEDQKRKGKGPFISTNYGVRDILVLPNGGMTIVSEFSRVSTFQDQLTYFNGDLIVSNLSEDGAFNWTRAVFKMQVYKTKSAGLSYEVVPGFYISTSRTVGNDKSLFYSSVIEIVDGDLIILFNDNPENSSNDVPRKKIESLTKPKNAVLMQVTVGSDGVIKKKVLKMSDLDDAKICPGVVYVNDEQGCIILYASDYKYGRVGRLTID